MTKILITFQRGSHVCPRAWEGVVLMMNLLWAETIEIHTRTLIPGIGLLNIGPAHVALKRLLPF